MFYIKISTILLILALVLLAVIACCLISVWLETHQKEIKEIFLQKKFHIGCKTVLVLGHSKHSACNLLKEIALANQDRVIRFTQDRIFFDDGYIFKAYSATDALFWDGLDFSQVISLPLFLGPAAKAHLNCIMERHGVPEEFRWITIRF